MFLFSSPVKIAKEFDSQEGKKKEYLCTRDVLKQILWNAKKSHEIQLSLDPKEMDFHGANSQDVVRQQKLQENPYQKNMKNFASKQRWRYPM